MAAPALDASVARMPSRASLAGSTSSATALPSRSSLAASPMATPAPSSPDGPRGRNAAAFSSPHPLRLPDPAFTPPMSPSHSAMGEAMQISKGAGLIRRLSRGAKNTARNTLVRRRRSSNAMASRDQSCGPVVMSRRRSGSKTAADGDSTPSFLALDGEEDGYDEAPFSLYDHADGPPGTPSAAVSPRRAAAADGLATPVVPDILGRGTTLTKVAKRKRKTLTFVLDVESAKVSWGGSNATKRLYVDDILEIRLQQEARHYREEAQIPQDAERCWFTIIYRHPDGAKGRPAKTMHLIAPSPALFELWTTALDDLSKYRHGLMAGLAGPGQDERTLQEHWKREMARRPAAHADDEFLDLAGVESLCRRLHVHWSKGLIGALFDQADASGRKRLGFAEFRDFVRRLKERKDVRKIYDRLTAASDAPAGLDFAMFLAFLEQSQGVAVGTDPAHWRSVFAKCVGRAGPDPAPVTASAMMTAGSSLMGFDALLAFLSSKHNGVVPTRPAEARLDRPLNEYFISSSHNTYLLGRQLVGDSSTEAYICALQRACRCVEIDCWDGPEGRPIVSHGRTMTTSVPFADCITVIGRYAFVASSHPLILSLEVHCNAVQQQAMVDIMVRELGPALVRQPLAPDASALPSPDDLRHRILVKVKAGEAPQPTGPAVEMPAQRRQRSFSSPFGRTQPLDSAILPDGPPLSSPPSMTPVEATFPIWATGRRSTATTTSLASTTDDSDVPRSPSVQAQGKPRRRKSKIIRSLGDLGVYSTGIKFRSFAQPVAESFNHVFSLAERTFESQCRSPEGREQIDRHNLRYLMRVYPSGYRLRSTNPDPLGFWRRGVQMVALNWQTYDLGMQMNEAMFASGPDRTGYVLKPPELRRGDAPAAPAAPGLAGPLLAEVPRQLVKFSVEMISAQQLHRPRGSAPDESLDPYVEIEMFSAEDKAGGSATGEGGEDGSARRGIGAPVRRRTKVVASNGYNPDFGETVIKMSVATKHPSLVFVRWTVWHSPDGRSYNTNNNAEPLASYTAKLDSLQQGFRHIPLYDHSGNRLLLSTLFCKITKEAPVTIERDDPIAEKPGRMRSIHNIKQSIKRTMSADRRAPKESNESGNSR